MQISTISAALWLVTITVQAAALFYSRKQSELFTYLLFQNLWSLSLVAAVHTRFYAHIFWTGDLLDVIVSFYLLYGIFRQTFAPYKTLPAGTLPRLIITVSVISTLLIATVFTPGILAMRQAAYMVIASVLVIFISRAKRLGIPWRHQLFGVTVGFGFQATVAVFSSAVSARFPQFIYPIAYVDRVAWLISLCIWLSYLAKPIASAQPVTIEQIDLLRKKTQGMSLHLKELTNHERIAHAVRHRPSRTA